MVLLPILVIAGTRNTHSYKDDDEIIAIDGGCPGIVSKEIYDKVQKRITENKHTGGKHNAKRTYLLSGLIYCRECGKAMVGNAHYSGRNKSLYITYKCPCKKYICSNSEIRSLLCKFCLYCLFKEFYICAIIMVL